MSIPTPTAKAESPTDITKLIHALIGLNLESSGGKVFSNSAFVG